MTQTPNTAGFSMEDLLAQMPMPVVPTPGAFLTVTVSHISAKEGVYLDFGGKGMGLIPRKDLDGEDLKPGDELTVQVVSETSDDEITICSVRNTRIWRELETARDTEGATVKVWVSQLATNSSKDFAGLRVKYRGVRGFIPRSKLGFGMHRAQTLVNTELEVKVHEVKLGEDATFDHRPVFEATRAQEEQTREQDRAKAREDRAAKRDTFLAEVPALAEFDAKVTTIGAKNGNEYGLFAEIAPGVSGLVHHTEIPGLKGKISEAFKRGDTIRVGVQSITDGRDGHKVLELSMRIPVLGGIPDEVETSGKVSKVAGFGVFVTLPSFSGIEGLVPSSLLSRAAGSSLKVGDDVRVKVMRRDLEQRRLTLSMRGIQQPGARKAS